MSSHLSVDVLGGGRIGQLVTETGTRCILVGPDAPKIDGFWWVSGIEVSQRGGSRVRLNLTVEVLPVGPELASHESLAVDVLAGETDAVWPLIDSIVERRDRPDLPTYGELLAALRERDKVILGARASRALGQGPRAKEEWDNDERVQALVARCEGVEA